MTVYITAKRVHRGQVYHTNEDCQQLKNGAVEKPERYAEMKGLDLCGQCDPENETDYSMNEKTCNKCGETFKQYPNHIPGCSGYD